MTLQLKDCSVWLRVLKHLIQQEQVNFIIQFSHFYKNTGNKMGFFTCNICEQQLTNEPHVCNPEHIKEHIRILKDRANTAESRLESIRNSIYNLIQPLSSLEGEEITVKTEWLSKLWDSAECCWYEAKTAK